MKKIKIEINLNSLQFELLSQESARRNLSIEELVRNLIEKYLLETLPIQDNMVADSDSTAGLGASKITDTDEYQYQYSVEKFDPDDKTTLSEIKQQFHLDDNQQYQYSVNGDFLTLNLGSDSPPRFTNIKKILDVIEEIEKLEFDDDLTDLSETYKQRLYSKNKQIIGSLNNNADAKELDEIVIEAYDQRKNLN